MKLHRLGALVTVLAIGLLSQGCGRLNSGAGLWDSEDDAKPVRLIVFGGNRSCKPDHNDRPTPLRMDMAAKIIGAINRLRSIGRQTDVLASCFLDYDKVRVTRNLEGEDQDLTVDDLIREAGDSSSNSSKLFIVGHSYGGWMAMKLAVMLSGRLPLNGLITVDPISRIKCTYSDWDGCFSAPQDINPEERMRIKDGTDAWSNFYQTNTPYLHSGKIEQADENEKVDSDHFDIDTHERVWRRLDEWL
ncbi:MAG: hypothetical protein RIQ81_2267 [Pseudomonadota bacterium]|jgi:hypothetical protein